MIGELDTGRTKGAETFAGERSRNGANVAEGRAVGCAFCGLGGGAECEHHGEANNFSFMRPRFGGCRSPKRRAGMKRIVQQPATAGNPPAGGQIQGRRAGKRDQCNACPKMPDLRLAVVGAGPVGLSLALHAASALPNAMVTLFNARPLDKDVSGDPRGEPSRCRWARPSPVASR